MKFYLSEPPPGGDLVQRDEMISLTRAANRCLRALKLKGTPGLLPGQDDTGQWYRLNLEDSRAIPENATAIDQGFETAGEDDGDDGGEDDTGNNGETSTLPGVILDRAYPPAGWPYNPALAVSNSPWIPETAAEQRIYFLNSRRETYYQELRAELVTGGKRTPGPDPQNPTTGQNFDEPDRNIQPGAGIPWTRRPHPAGSSFYGGPTGHFAYMAGGLDPLSVGSQGFVNPPNPFWRVSQLESFSPEFWNEYPDLWRRWRHDLFVTTRITVVEAAPPVATGNGSIVDITSPTLGRVVGVLWSDPTVNQNQNPGGTGGATSTQIAPGLYQNTYRVHNWIGATGYFDSVAGNNPNIPWITYPTQWPVPV